MRTEIHVIRSLCILIFTVPGTAIAQSDQTSADQVATEAALPTEGVFISKDYWSTPLRGRFVVPEGPNEPNFQVCGASAPSHRIEPEEVVRDEINPTCDTFGRFATIGEGEQRQWEGLEIRLPGAAGLGNPDTIATVESGNVANGEIETFVFGVSPRGNGEPESWRIDRRSLQLEYNPATDSVVGTFVSPGCYVGGVLALDAANCTADLETPSDEATLPATLPALAIPYAPPS
jgi:hypothetical protein